MTSRRSGPGRRPLLIGALRRDDGAAPLEYVGVIAFVGALMIGLWASALAAQPGKNYEWAICKILTFGQGDCTSAPEAIDREPQEPCVVSADGGEASVTAGVVFFGEGGDIWLIEELGDGRFRVTHGVGLAGGAEGGAGGKIEVTINDQEYGGEAGLSGMAKIGVQVGDVYYADSMDAAEDLLGKMRYETYVPSWMRTVAGALGGPDSLPEPDTVWFDASVSMEGEASADATMADISASAGLDAAIGTQLNKDGSATVYLDAKISGEVAGSVGVSLLDDGYQGKHEAEGSTLDFDKLALGASIGGNIGATVQVDYDSEGNATAIRMTSTMGWSGDVTAQLLGEHELAGGGTTAATTLELPLDSAQNKEIAAAMLANMGIPYVPGISTEPRLPDLVNGTDGLLGPAQDFADAVLDRGRVWIDTYTEDDHTPFGLKVEGAFGGKFNLGGEYTTTTRESVEQRYFDGTGWVVREGCSA